ncbi:putative WD repeat-containing protein [Porphyridium purpureum]|uniref:Putative WD repeat-containing protein n=1 Tax=Porphyridium purpureum TaxID=35688 RepID=A0A5J4YY68_PORPP|nr:putative WD repeat-containing protein [Porphyridium purpureum]|eukprot:POR8300..scf209_3
MWISERQQLRALRDAAGAAELPAPDTPHAGSHVKQPRKRSATSVILQRTHPAAHAWRPEYVIRAPHATSAAQHAYAVQSMGFLPPTWRDKLQATKSTSEPSQLQAQEARAQFVSAGSDGKLWLWECVVGKHESEASLTPLQLLADLAADDEQNLTNDEEPEFCFAEVSTYVSPSSPALLVAGTSTGSLLAFREVLQNGRGSSVPSGTDSSTGPPRWIDAACENRKREGFVNRRVFRSSMPASRKNGLRGARIEHGAFSSTGRVLIVGDDAGRVSIFRCLSPLDTKFERVGYFSRPHADAVNFTTVSASSDAGGEWLCASGSEDGTVCVFGVSGSGKAELKHTLRGHAACVNSLAFCSPPYSSERTVRLASVSADATARIWDADTGNLLHTLQHDGSPVEWACSEPRRFSLLATGAYDGILRVWHVTTGELVARCVGHKGKVVFIEWSACGHFLSTGSTDGTARLWQIITRPEAGRQCGTNSIDPDANWRCLAEVRVSHRPNVTVLEARLTPCRGGLLTCTDHGEVAITKLKNKAAIDMNLHGQESCQHAQKLAPLARHELDARAGTPSPDAFPGKRARCTTNSSNAAVVMIPASPAASGGAPEHTAEPCANALPRASFTEEEKGARSPLVGDIVTKSTAIDAADIVEDHATSAGNSSNDEDDPIIDYACVEQDGVLGNDLDETDAEIAATSILRHRITASNDILAQIENELVADAPSHDQTKLLEKPQDFCQEGTRTESLLLPQPKPEQYQKEMRGAVRRCETGILNDARSAEDTKPTPENTQRPELFFAQNAYLIQGTGGARLVTPHAVSLELFGTLRDLLPAESSNWAIRRALCEVDSTGLLLRQSLDAKGFEWQISRFTRSSAKSMHPLLRPSGNVKAHETIFKKQHAERTHVAHAFLSELTPTLRALLIDATQLTSPGPSESSSHSDATAAEIRAVCRRYQELHELTLCRQAHELAGSHAAAFLSFMR